MYKKFIFNSKSLSEYFGYPFDKNFEVNSVSTVNLPKSNTLMFITKLDDNIKSKISKVSNCIILLSKEYSDYQSSQNIILYVDRPRKEYALLLKYILENQYVSNKKYKSTENNYVIGTNTIIGANTIIEPFCFIDHDVKIGSNCIIKSGARIRSGCIIGDNCIVKENSVIGSSGFGVERDDDGTTYKIPHIGGVIIGNNVEIGALSAIASGTIEASIINDFVKIDDTVFIAHNCKIGKGTLLTANCEVSGSVIIGENSWVGPNSCIKDQIIIGDRVTVGIGTVVTRNIENDQIVAGNPAIPIGDLKRLRNIQKNMLSNL